MKKSKSKINKEKGKEKSGFKGRFGEAKDEKPLKGLEQEGTIDRMLNFQPAKMDHEKIPLDVFGVLIGKRRRGKSVYLEWLLSEMAPFYPGGAYVFTKTKNNYFWQKHIPEECIYDGFQGDVIKAIIEEQKKKVEAIRNDGKITDCPYVLIIMDDIIGDTHLNWEEELRDLAFAGRHYMLGCWITTQDCKGIGPAIRSQADIIGLSYTTSKRVIDAIKDDYAYIFSDAKMLVQLIKEQTMDHQFLIVDQSDAKYSLDETFFVDKAPDPSSNAVKPYKIGSDKFWMDRHCDWKNQTRQFKNMPKLERNQWLRVAKRQAKREKMPKAEEEEGKFTHYTIGMASKEQQEAYKEAFKQKWDNLPTSKEKVNDFMRKLQQGYVPTSI